MVYESMCDAMGDEETRTAQQEGRVYATPYSASFIVGNNPHSRLIFRFIMAIKRTIYGDSRRTTCVKEQAIRYGTKLAEDPGAKKK